MDYEQKHERKIKNRKVFMPEVGELGKLLALGKVVIYLN